MLFWANAKKHDQKDQDIVCARDFATRLWAKEGKMPSNAHKQEVILGLFYRTFHGPNVAQNDTSSMEKKIRFFKT